MKKIFTLFSFCMLFGIVQAQLPDGATVQNFEVTDLNGNTYELYDILNEGKSVVIDVYATWCGPCWSYHTAGDLKDVWELYGPDGTNEIFVMGIEGDGSTPIDAIYGTGGGTLGDWTSGVYYPMIDDAGVANQLQINYFPTIYIICQDRTIREAGQISAEAMYDLHNSCAQPVGNNNGSLTNYKGYIDNVCGEFAYAPEITLENNGGEIISTATLTASVNGEVAATIDFTGELYPFERSELEFSDITVYPGDEISIDIANINGEMDEDDSDNLFTTSVEVPATVPSNVLNIEIQTDNKGHEIYWRVIKPNGTKLAEGGNIFVNITGAGTQSIMFGGYDDNSLEQKTVELPEDGCYKFVIVDNWGDGLSGDGYYKVTDGEGNVVAEGADFGARADRTLDVEYFVRTNEIQGLEAVEIFPNPTQNDLNINLELSETIDAGLHVTDVTGKLIQTQKLGQLSSGNHQFNVSLNDMPTGVYYVELITETGILTKKVVKM